MFSRERLIIEEGSAGCKIERLPDGYHLVRADRTGEIYKNEEGEIVKHLFAQEWRRREIKELWWKVFDQDAVDDLCKALPGGRRIYR